MPFSNPLSNLFAKSPIKPMQEHMAVVNATAALLKPFFEAALAGDWEQAAELQKRISAEEFRADVMKKNLRLNLPSGLFMPVSRGDLLELLSEQDKVANCAEDIAGLMLGRRMVIPDVLREPMVQLLDTALAACEQANAAINELHELLETGFAGQEVSFVERLLERLDQLEQDADTQERNVRHELFLIEKDLPPVDVMFTYNIIDDIGRLADTAQRVGNRLQLLLAR